MRTKRAIPHLLAHTPVMRRLLLTRRCQTRGVAALLGRHKCLSANLLAKRESPAERMSTRKILHWLERDDVPVGLSSARGINPFPWEYRPSACSTRASASPTPNASCGSAG